MLKKDELTLICRESVKTGMKCVGEVDGEKIYRVCYETVEYYLNEQCSALYTVYNHNFDDYDVEYLDLGACKMMKVLKILKEEF